jgi:hypothetical protein
MGVMAAFVEGPAGKAEASHAEGPWLEAAKQPVLPPVQPWNGKSRAVIARPSDPWITPCEQSGFVHTPRYDETMAWLRRLTEAVPEIEMQILGKSPEGRDVWLVIATHAGGFTPEALRGTGKPIVFAQAGIHPGEIDGKDAGMMLLRDLTVGGSKRALLDGASFLFVPIVSVDGHEQFSARSRINQRGPSEAGWRTNARNLNLNRDFAKLDTPEMRAVVGALAKWDPDLFIDLHVTDGADFQYDITWGVNGRPGWSPAITRWIESVLTPALEADLEREGHIPGPFCWPRDEHDFTKGFQVFSGIPRFSNGYGDARHLPTVLVENHSLKPYEQRVLGTYVFLESALRAMAAQAAGLRAAMQADRAQRTDSVVVSWRISETAQSETLDYLGISSRRVRSPVTGTDIVEWTGKPITLQVPYWTMNEPVGKAVRPRAYWIPPGWSDVAERVAAHGVTVERIAEPRTVEVEMDRIVTVELDTLPNEGHVRMKAAFAVEHQRRTFPAGSVRVPTDQPLGTLAVLLLDPRSPDSFFQWGFFGEVLQRTEYVEEYIMAPTAERMLAESARLRSEWEAALAADSAFAANPRARLAWFYRRTPHHDAEARLDPVAREL